MLPSVLAFVTILNPFALCLYMADISQSLDSRTFASVVARATALSFFVFVLFAFAGERLLHSVLGVEPSALRIFGGLIFFIIAYNYVTKGYKATEVLRGTVDELPSAIALPFMIGAGTITQAMLIGRVHTGAETLAVLVASLILSVVVLMSFHFISNWLSRRKERILERYLNSMARLNGLLIGAISIQMIVEGLHELWQTAG